MISDFLSPEWGRLRDDEEYVPFIALKHMFTVF